MNQPRGHPLYKRPDRCEPAGEPPHAVQGLCEAWQWKQANGALRDMVCRGLLLMLERAGYIALPPVKFVPHNPLVRRVQPLPVLIDTTLLEGSLDQIQPLEFVQVRRGADEPLFNSLIEEHHY